MSLIGSLELYKLSNILRRLEAHEKTGLLIIKQGGGTWVELYFRDGRLMCIGPLRTTASLADRLLYDGIISSKAYQEVLRIVGADEKSEIPFAIALMDSGFASQEQLRSWASKKTIEVLQVLLSWASGEIHFEEQVSPHSDRLLVALSISSLLVATPEVGPTAQSTRGSSDADWLLDRSQTPRPSVSPPSSKPYVARIPTLTQPSQFFGDAFSSTSTPMADVSPTSLFPAGGDVASSFPQATPMREISPVPHHAVSIQNVDMPPTIPAPQEMSFTSSDASGKFSAASLLSDVILPFADPFEPAQPTPMTPAAIPSYVDISYMRPEMILMPADLSTVRDSHTVVQITPEQWRLLTRVDGQTTLQAVCQDLNMAPEVVCRLAGELISQMVITLSLPSAPQVEEISPVARELMASGLGNGYVAPGYAAATTSPLSAPSAPLTGPIPMPQSIMAVAQPSSQRPFETESQWGNGGNGAIFVPGRGWLTPQQMQAQPMPGSGTTGVYTSRYMATGGH